MSCGKAWWYDKETGWERLVEIVESGAATFTRVDLLARYYDYEMACENEVFRTGILNKILTLGIYEKPTK